MELKYMPRVAARYLCWMLRLIEAGAPWPAAILQTKCVHLAKAQAYDGNPLGYRGLMVASAIYRAWA
eukprot:4869852-Alexandrium_andersonii.AAC.1